jgi:hypothetical protein
MKAERRHDLKTNTLATTLVELPTFWKQYGTKILVAAVAIVAVALLIQHRIQSRAEAHQLALDDLAKAQDAIMVLRSPITMMRPPLQAITTVKTNADQASDAIADVLNLATNPQIRAEALVASGDLNLLLAHLPAIPGATTQPALQKPLSDDEYRNRAADAYEQVLHNFLDHRSSAITAHFGMATIEEDRGNWSAAAEHYKKISDDPSAPMILRALAQRRLTEDLPNMQIAPLIGSTTQPIAMPASAPSTAPSTKPTM